MALEWNPTQRVATSAEYDLYLQNLRLTQGQPAARTLPDTFVMAAMPTGYVAPAGYEQEYAVAAQQVKQYTPVATVPIVPILPPKVEQKVVAGQEVTENDILELIIAIICWLLGQSFEGAERSAPVSAMQQYEAAKAVQKQEEVARAREIATAVQIISKEVHQPIGYKPSANVW